MSAATLSTNPLAPKAPMFPAKAKRVIFLYMQGAPSQYETFDYCPELGAAKSGSLMAPAFKFTKSGQSGIPISDLFPNLQKQADDWNRGDLDAFAAGELERVAAVGLEEELLFGGLQFGECRLAGHC